MNKRINTTYFLISIILICLIFFQWKIVDIITPYLMMYFYLIVAVTLFYMLVYSAIDIIDNFIKKIKINFIPFIITFVTIIIIIFIPLKSIYIDLDYLIYQNKREEVINMVYNELQMEDINYLVYKLPKKYKSVSCARYIIIEKYDENKIVLFFTYIGIMNSFSGFVYVPDDYILSDEAFCSYIIQKREMDNNWYWISGILN